MKIIRLTLAIALTLAITGCSNSENIAYTSWQVTEVYTTPEYPPELPEEIAGSVVVNFGNSTLNGFTGCAPFNATVEFTKAEGDQQVPSTNSEADHMKIPEVIFGDTEPDSCTGHVLFVHNAMTDFLKAQEFTLSRPAEKEMVVTVFSTDPQAVDQPAIRLAQ